MCKETEGLLCWNCRHIVPFSIERKQRIRTVNNIDYEYVEQYGVCAECHNKISVPGLDDDNENRFDLIFRRMNGLITVGEIRKLLEKYDIEKRPLSHLLGFGEHTISRYLEGQIPNREYSDLLLLLLHNHLEMEKRLEEGKDRITNVAYRKVAKKINVLKELTRCDNKIDLVALYITNSAYDITDLSLQKLLYFVKAFSLGVFDGDGIFDGACEAWAYGPVFPAIYAKYKGFGDSLIPSIDLDADFFSKLDSEDKRIIDYILDNFGRLNGKVLMDITHMEAPWNNARLGLEAYEPSNNVISDESIKRYYKSINDKYDLSKREGVNSYIDDLFSEQ